MQSILWQLFSRIADNYTVRNYAESIWLECSYALHSTSVLYIANLP